MKFNLLFASSVSATFELENDKPYYSEKTYDVSVNGASVLSDVRTNVFSLFDLMPDTAYRVNVEGDEIEIRTLKETACITAAPFGAKGDGVTNDTVALQNAIYACPTGGRLRVEKGTYLTGPLILKSDMTLELCDGAELLGDTVESHYPIWPGSMIDPASGEEVHISSWEGCPKPGHQSFISAHYAKNVYIVGRGVINGNANNSTWWNNPKNREFERPKLVFLNKCENVIFQGITGKNSPSWNFHPFFSKKIYFFDTAVEAPANSPNTDGTDPESCDDVKYIGMRFSVGDDAIAIKAGKMYMGMKYKTPASNHVIRNCLMEYAHGAVVLGSEMSGGVKDLTVSQCYFLHTDRGLRIKTRRGRGKYAIIDGVEFSNIRMDNVLTPLVINMYYFCDVDGKTEAVQSKEPKPVDDGTPYLGAFTFRDMVCTDCEWAAGFFYGLPEMPIGSVTIENVSFDFKEEAGEGFPAMMCGIDKHSKSGLVFYNVDRINLNNVSVKGHVGEKLVLSGVKELHDN